MDNTEVHYLTYDPESIYNSMIDAYIEAGGDVLYPGDEKDLLLQGVLAVIVQVLAGVDNALRMDTLRYAVGEYLDIYGEKRGCERLQAQSAQAKVKITFRPSGHTGTLYAGTALTADGEMVYELVEDVEYTGMAQEAEADIVCIREGAAGNELESETQMQFMTGYDFVQSVYCIESATGGMEEEDDEEYRERIREYGLGNVTTGPKESYERMATEVSNEIIDANAVMTDPGEVEVSLILSSDTGKDALLESVRNALSDETVRPLTDNVTVKEATKKLYTLNVGYKADAKLTSAITAAVNEYTSWQTRTIERAFNPEMLISLLYQAGATRVTIDSGSVFNGSTNVKYTEIGHDEYCYGTVNLRVIT